MARRKLANRHTRNIQQSHNVYYVTLPVELVRALKWQERQKVVVKKFGRDKIIIKDWPEKKP
jgi:bifunctional DNA-binding transcriptional regulator/antitoxin component of YhaV-PrlF toxin-antitoxin module